MLTKVCGVSVKGDRVGVGEDAAEDLLDKLLVDPEAEQRGRHLMKAGEPSKAEQMSCPKSRP